MSPTIHEYILWGLGALSTAVGGYAKSVQRALRNEREERQEQYESLEGRINTLQIQMASFEGTHTALQRVELQLLNLSQLTHRIAGHLGID